ncbi:MAG: MotA/TolQ/ExbB proton channel family protein [Deltaproteobacteria bacterium]|nr:MotA/TolQ/ExbB proton channel family protein [Deltaproteobacteria bacterium]
MDLGSLIGIISGISLIVAAIIVGGDVHNFINTPGIMIVLGGTVATTLLTFRFKEVIAAFKAAFFVFTQEKEDPNKMVKTMVDLCQLSRREGLMKVGEIKTESRFLKKACQLISDSSEEDVIRSALTNEIESLKVRHFMVQDVFRKMGLYSPAFGMLGTLIGLVQMLSKMQDPSSIGPSMAVALLTTFYGSFLSTMLFLPIAGKLKVRTLTQVMELDIIFEGAVSILDNNNPTLVYEKLSSHIPKKERKPMRSKRVR